MTQSYLEKVAVEETSNLFGLSGIPPVSLDHATGWDGILGVSSFSLQMDCKAVVSCSLLTKHRRQESVVFAKS
jgi:hypothetical protein